MLSSFMPRRLGSCIPFRRNASQRELLSINPLHPNSKWPTGVPPAMGKHVLPTGSAVWFRASSRSTRFLATAGMADGHTHAQLPVGVMTWPERDYGCGVLRASNIGQRVSLCGWVDKQRNLGGMVFVDLRDHTGILQATTLAKRSYMFSQLTDCVYARKRVTQRAGTLSTRIRHAYQRRCSCTEFNECTSHNRGY